MLIEKDFNVTEAFNELKQDKIIAWVKDQLEQKVLPQNIAKKLTLGLNILGDRFASGECFIPELIAGGTIFGKAMDILRPAFEATKTKTNTSGTMLIGTVKGDLHDLGKNLVSIIFIAEGFEVINLGVDVPTERFIEETRCRKPDVLGLSSLLTTTLETQREVIHALELEGLRGQVKVIVGGAPVTQMWAEEIGADAYGSDAIDGLRKVKSMLKI